MTTEQQEYRRAKAKAYCAEYSKQKKEGKKARKRYYERNRVAIITKNIEYAKQYSKTEKGRDSRRRYVCKWRYGIGIADMKKIIDKQGGLCACCDRPLDSIGKHRDTKGSARPHVDHNHTTGKIRGVLCFRCNVLLGNAGDSIDILRRAIQYIKKSEN